MIKGFAVCLLVTAFSFAQGQSFASIDVRPARSVDPQALRMRVLPNGDLTGASVNVITLISEGYGVPSNPSERLSTLPSWVYSERYDIQAKARAHATMSDLSAGRKHELVREMFRQILIEQFRLAFQVENRRMPVYALAVATGGPKLMQSSLASRDCIFDTAPDGCHSFVIGFGHPLNAKAVDMDDLAHYLENWTDLPVVNKTALDGLFTMSTEGWRPIKLPPPPRNGVGNLDFTRLPSIDAILGGVGLELRRQEENLPIYRVEHIERPSMHGVTVKSGCRR